MLLDEISFKNSYLLLSSILEESYYLIANYAKNYSDYELPDEYSNFSFKKNNSVIKESKNTRFLRVAHLVRNVANVLKHSGGIVENNRSGNILINEFKIKSGTDIVLCKEFIKISGIPIGNIFIIISRLYIFMIDLIAFLFNFKKFRIKNTEHHKIEESIVNYDVRDEYNSFLKSIQKDGSVIFIDL